MRKLGLQHRQSEHSRGPEGYQMEFFGRLASPGDTYAVQGQNENWAMEEIELRCITPREMARLCIGAFMIATQAG